VTSRSASTSGSSENVVRAIELARSRDVRTVAFTRSGPTPLAAAAEQCIAIPSTDTPRIQECHVLLGHTLCELVEREMFPDAVLQRPAVRPGPGAVSAVFLDRDGTLNVKAPDGDYVTSSAQLRMLRGAADAVAALGRAGIAVFVVPISAGSRWAA